LDRCCLLGFFPRKTPAADLVLIHGHILTVDANDSVAQAVAVRQVERNFLWSPLSKMRKRWEMSPPHTILGALDQVGGKCLGLLNASEHVLISCGK
jgi:hypothetical protein